MNNALRWYEYFFNIAKNAANMSNCQKRQIGAVIVRDKNIISVGYNGPLPGAPHCHEDICNNGQKVSSTHSVCSLRSCHAESNAIAFAAKNGVSTKDSILYTTTSPCDMCLKLIAMAGINTIYYLELYINNDENYNKALKNLYKESNITFYQYPF